MFLFLFINLGSPTQDTYLSILYIFVTVTVFFWCSHSENKCYVRHDTQYKYNY